jgi:hypothetical protein
MDRRRLHASDDVECDRLVRVAAKATDFEIGIARVQRIADRRRRLRLQPKHALVPSLAGERDSTGKLSIRRLFARDARTWVRTRENFHQGQIV